LYFCYHAIPELQGMVGGLGPVVIALILDAGWSIGRRVLRSPGAVAVAALALAAGMLKVNTLWILLCAGGGSLLLMRMRSPAAPGVHAMLLPVASGGGAVATLAGTFLKVGLVFFGGGFVLVPVLHQRLVTELHWLTGREFIDGLAISNLTPGPVAVMATFAGFRQAGVTGALVATAALLAPSAVLMLVFSRQYAAMRGDARVQVFLDGLNPAVTGLIVSAAALLAGEALTSWQRWVFACVSLVVLRALEWPPIVLLAVAAVGGYFGWLG
jgi:chromate transporter